MKGGIKVSVRVDPSGETPVFRSNTTDDVLRLLADAHEAEFSITELVEITGAARASVSRAVDHLDSLDVIRVRETPQRKYVAIDPAALEKDDPVLTIEQTEFHAPVRSFVGRVGTALDDADGVNRLVGVVVFGSVARGEADRASDIDLFIVVDGDRTAARRRVADVASDLRETRFDGDRFEFEPYVESVESVRRAGEKIAEIFDEGITVRGSETLNELRKAVVTDE